ncbi:MAG TPA: hypothetical protein VHQ65_13730 [Thermoanaerobaculia bacterium]|nr:hypothetical protein [Thermoanaerobaculia bacterium]
MKKSLLRLGLATLLVAASSAVTAPAWGDPAAAGPAAGERPGISPGAGVEWITGLLANLFDPWNGDGGGKEAPVDDQDSVRGPAGSGIDPSGVTSPQRPNAPPRDKN